MAVLKYGKRKHVDRHLYKRACDICGHNWPFNKLRYIGEGRYACPDDAPGLTAEQLQRHQARMKPLIVRPRAHAKIQGSVSTYQADEAIVLDLVAKYATTASSVGPTGAVVASTNQVQVAAPCGLYLRELLRENERPLAFLTRARAALLQIGTYLLTAQFGSSTGPSPAEATDSIRYGGLGNTPGSTTMDPQTTARAGLTFLQLYAETGDASWLSAADRVGWCLRQSQRADALTVGFTNDGTSRQYFGCWVNVTNHIPANGAALDTAECFWFVSELRKLRGGSTVYGSATATGDFATAPAGSLDTMIADALLFYVDGKMGYGAGDGSIVAMLSANTPQALFVGSSSPRFTLSTLGGSYFGLTAAAISCALRGLFELEGYSARVAVIFEWLMSFTSNPAFETPAGTVLSEIDKLRTGTYDPTVAPALGLALNSTSNSVKLPVFTMNGGATGTGDIYSYAAAGRLGPLYEASGRNCAVAKDALAKPRVSVTDRNVMTSLGRAGTSGLSFQSFGVNASPANAALTGLIYRAAPNGNPLLRGLP